MAPYSSPNLSQQSLMNERAPLVPTSPPTSAISNPSSNSNTPYSKGANGNINYRNNSNNSPSNLSYPDPNDVAIPKNLWLIIISLWTGSFLSAADSTIVATTANKIASSMNGSDQITWIAASYLLTNAIFQPLVAKMSEIFGRRTTLLVAQFWFGFGCLCCSCSTSVLQFSVSRGLAGVGGGGLSALSSIIVTDVVPLRLRGIFQGYANLMYGMGQFIGPVIGGLFLTVDPNNGWRWMFGLQVPLVLLAAYLVKNNVHEFIINHEERLNNRYRIENFKRIDFAGSLTLSVVIVCSILLFSAKSRTEVGICLGVAIVFTILFWIIETYVATDTIIPLFAWKGILRLSAITVMFGTMTMYGLNFIIPGYLQIVQDFTPLQLSIFNAFGVFSTSTGSLLAGWYLKHDEKVETEKILIKAVNFSILGFLLIFMGTLATMIITMNAKPAATQAKIDYIQILLLGLSYFTSGVGYGAYLVTLLILVVGIVGLKHQASVTGMNYLFRSIGSASGTGITLSINNSILSKELYSYFIQKARPDGETIYNKLLDNFFYIRNGLPSKYVHKVLKIYREANGDTMVLIFLMASAALVSSLIIRLYMTFSIKGERL